MNGPLRPSGKEDIYAVVDKYLDYVIHYDQPFVATKYNIQQHIGGDQVSKQIIIEGEQKKVHRAKFINRHSSKSI